MSVKHVEMQKNYTKLESKDGEQMNQSKLIICPVIYMKYSPYINITVLK